MSVGVSVGVGMGVGVGVARAEGGAKAEAKAEEKKGEVGRTSQQRRSRSRGDSVGETALAALAMGTAKAAGFRKTTTNKEKGRTTAATMSTTERPTKRRSTSFAALNEKLVRTDGKKK